MTIVSRRQSFLSLLAVATEFALFVQHTDSFLLPGPKADFSPPTEKEFLGHSIDKSFGNIANDNDSTISNDFIYPDPNGYISSDSTQLDTGRRQSILLAMASWVAAPSLWAFPAMARASSPNSAAATTNTTKPKDLPINFDLSAAVQTLLDLDEPNRLVPGKDYALNVQGRHSIPDEDAAPDPLFRYVDTKVLEDRPTYQSFVALLDNYQPNVCLEDDTTPETTKEAYAFLRACMATPAMRFCYSYCKSKLQEREISEQGATTNVSSNYSWDTEEDFVQLLYRIWFTTYSRSKGCDKNSNSIGNDTENSDSGKESSGKSNKKVYGSSGFEHVFVGEIRKGKVIGFHNWIQLYRQETAGNLDYRGTMRTKVNDRILTYNLKWMGSEKPVGTSWMGVSPEFELALYTMVFLVGNPKDNIVLVDLGSHAAGGGKAEPTRLDIKCFRTKGRVGSCYIEAP